MYEDLPRYVENFINSQNDEANAFDRTKKIIHLTERIKQRYFHNKPFTEENIPSIIRFLSDMHFNIPVEDFVNRRRKKKQVSTYFYKFSYVGNETTETKLMENKLTTIGIRVIQLKPS